MLLCVKLVVGYKDPEKNRAYNRSYYQKCRDRLLADAKVRSSTWQRDNRDRVNASQRKLRLENREQRLAIEKASKLKLKLEVLAALGGACSCCGEKQHEFLSIDHVQNDGNLHKKSYQTGSGALYRQVRDAGCPRERFQVLCHNCNWSKRVGGVCVHQRTQAPPVAKWVYSQKSKAKLRREVLSALGGSCACCSERELEFLCLDHIHENGGEHRSEIGRANVYRAVRSEGCPKTKYQALCQNCNRSKTFGAGRCWHVR